MSEPYAEIEQVGRWMHRITVHDGITMWALDGIGWHVLGRDRAERKARRLLAKYALKQQRSEQSWRVYEQPAVPAGVEGWPIEGRGK